MLIIVIRILILMIIMAIMIEQEEVMLKIALELLKLRQVFTLKRVIIQQL